jgi:hypothetical protein
MTANQVAHAPQAIFFQSVKIQEKPFFKDFENRNFKLFPQIYAQFFSKTAKKKAQSFKIFKFQKFGQKKIVLPLLLLLLPQVMPASHIPLLYLTNSLLRLHDGQPSSTRPSGLILFCFATAAAAAGHASQPHPAAVPDQQPAADLPHRATLQAQQQQHTGKHTGVSCRCMIQQYYC